MNNLITLSCPSCGANLEVPSGTKQFSCKYCGKIHVLSDSQHAAIADSVLCPIDYHQDNLLKVSAIVKSQVFEAPAGSSQDIPITYKSQLAQKLLCPPKPHSIFAVFMTSGGIMFLILIAILLFAFVGNAILSTILPGNDLYGFILFFVIGALAASPFAKNLLIPMLSKKNNEYRDKLKLWQIDKKCWDNSFYCQRHDVVFMKGNNQAIPVDKFQSFLWSKEDSSKM